MRDGVVVMLDALGFKGIWKAADEAARAAELLAQMKRLRDAAKHARVEPNSANPFAMRCECISDTVVLGIWPNADSSLAPAVALPVLWAVNMTRRLCEWALSQSIVLAYRGAIAAGRFEMEDGFIIGPAVDDAATHMELADGAFIWLTPSALARVGHEALGSSFAHKYAIPLKDGKTFETFALAPWYRETLEGSKVGADALLNTFNKPDLGVVIKKQNTSRFFDLALREEAARKAHFTNLQEQARQALSAKP